MGARSCKKTCDKAFPQATSKMAVQRISRDMGKRVFFSIKTHTFHFSFIYIDRKNPEMFQRIFQKGNFF